MNKFTRRRAKDLPNTRALPCLRPIVAACSLLFATGASYAQQAPAEAPAEAPTATPASSSDSDQSLEPIIVTGIRHSIETSISTKRDSDSIIEAVSAEDIGKLPDVSIADALSRLPGLAEQRVNGRAQVIAIRGMSPDFAGTLLNGREMVTTGDNRGVEFDQFPSELINSAVVYKTPDAGLLGQGLSGTIDMRTVRPLDVTGRVAAFNVRHENNSQGEITPGANAKGTRLSASYIDQFADRKIGVALGIAYLDSPTLTTRQQIWGYDQNGQGGPTPKNFPAPYTQAWLPNGDQVQAIYDENKRTGLMGVLEFAPNNDLHSTVDLYYSKFDNKETMRGLFWYQGVWAGGANSPGGNPGPGTNITNAVFRAQPDGSYLLTGANISGIDTVVRNDYNTRNDKISAIGWNTKYTAGGWDTVADLSYSRATTDQTLFETYAGSNAPSSVPPGSFTMNMTADPNALGNATFIPGLNYADPAVSLLGDPANYGHDGRKQLVHQTDTLKALRLEGKHALDGKLANPIFNYIDAGLNYSVRDKEKDFNVLFANLKTGYVGGGTSQQVAPDLILAPTNLGFAGIPGILSYDVNGVAARYYNMVQNLSGSDKQQDFTVTEKITTLFAKTSIDHEVAHTPIRGNLGFDLVHSNQSSSANEVSGATNNITGTRIDGTAYNDVLPSLNLVAELGDGYFARFGAAKTLARPRMDQEKAATSASVATSGQNLGLWGGSGGNPQLKPWRAKSLDLSLEKYFGKRSYVALAAFHKSLTSWVSSVDLPFDFSGWVNDSGTSPRQSLGTMTTPVNRSGGIVHGGELSAALEGNMLAREFDGFGMLISTSLTISSVQDDLTNQTLTLPGLSKKVVNWTFYYEKYGFQARVSERYRSDYRGEISGLFGARSYDNILADKQIDGQVGYEIQSGPFKDLSVLLQVNNLTNSPYRTTQTFASGLVAPKEFDLYGRQILVGLNYKLQ